MYLFGLIFFLAVLVFGGFWVGYNLFVRLIEKYSDYDFNGKGFGNLEFRSVFYIYLVITWLVLSILVIIFYRYWGYSVSVGVIFLCLYTLSYILGAIYGNKYSLAWFYRYDRGYNKGAYGRLEMVSDNRAEDMEKLKQSHATEKEHLERDNQSLQSKLNNANESLALKDKEIKELKLKNRHGDIF